MPGLLDDLIAYVNHGDVDPMSPAAVAQAKVEIIHPSAI